MTLKIKKKYTISLATGLLMFVIGLMVLLWFMIISLIEISVPLSYSGGLMFAGLALIATTLFLYLKQSKREDLDNE